MPKIYTDHKKHITMTMKNCINNLNFHCGVRWIKNMSMNFMILNIIGCAVRPFSSQAIFALKHVYYYNREMISLKDRDKIGLN